MLTETAMGMVFIGHFSAVAVLPFLAWQKSVADAWCASFDRMIGAQSILLDPQPVEVRHPPSPSRQRGAHLQAPLSHPSAQAAAGFAAQESFVPSATSMAGGATS